MKTLIYVLADHSMFVGPTVPADFDTQSWANARRSSFRLSEIVRIIERLE